SPHHKGSTSAPDLSIADDAHSHPAGGRSAATGGAGGAGATLHPPGPTSDGPSAGGAGHVPSGSGDSSSSADSPSASTPVKSASAQKRPGSKSTHSSTTTGTGPSTPTVPNLGATLPGAGGHGGVPLQLPNGIGSKPDSN